MLRLVFPLDPKGCSGAPQPPSVSHKASLRRQRSFGLRGPPQEDPRAWHVRKGPHPFGYQICPQLTHRWVLAGRVEVGVCVVQTQVHRGPLEGSPEQLDFFWGLRPRGKTAMRLFLSPADLSSLLACSGLWCLLSVWLFQNVFIFIFC